MQDWHANSGNKKGQLVLLCFRSAQKIRRAPRMLYLVGIPCLIIYRVVIEWVLCIELPWNTQVGPGLRLFHGMGSLVNDQTIIGNKVVLRHSTTIGVKETLPFGTRAAPTIGDGVDVGAHVVILGPVNVGHGARIGAGSVVVKDVPAGATVVGNPARVINASELSEQSHG